MKKSPFYFLFIVLVAVQFASAQMPAIPGTNPAAPAAPTPAPAPARNSAVRRIGIMLPKAQLGQANNLQDVGEPIRHAIAGFLTGPGIEIVPIAARLPIQAVAEAKDKQCDFLLTAAIAQKRGGGGGFGSFMKMAGPMANMIPGMAAVGGGMGGQMAGVVAQTVVQAAAQAAANATPDMASVSGDTIRAKDELTLDYQLITLPDGAKAAGASLKGKARSDGEDVLTQLIEQLANAVYQTVKAANQ